MRSLILLQLVVLLITASRAYAEPCVGQLGEPIEFKSGCKSFRFPSFKIVFDGSERPNPKVAMHCWNYRVHGKGDEVKKLSLCNSGSLGGESHFTLAGKKYVVDRDVPAKCIDKRWVLGLRIWEHTSELPPYKERLKSLPRLDSFQCEPNSKQM